MNINNLRYFLFGIAGDQEVDHTFVKFIIYPLTIISQLLRNFEKSLICSKLTGCVNSA